LISDRLLGNSFQVKRKLSMPSWRLGRDAGRIEIEDFINRGEK